MLRGSLGEAHAKKIVIVMDLAGKAGCPFIAINDSGGARILEGAMHWPGMGKSSSVTSATPASFYRSR